MKYFAALILAIALSGCRTTLESFYSPEDPGCETVATTPVRTIRTSEEYIVNKEDRYSPGYRRDPQIQALLDQGYVRIGNSSFTTGEYINVEMIIKHAEKVGAGAIVFYAWQPVTTSYRTVIPIYNEGQTYQSNFSGVGPGGYYAGTVTTTGPSTLSMMPVQGTETTQEWVIAYYAKKK